MKTTVEINDAMYAELRRRAAQDGLSMREIFEAALRNYLQREKQKARQFRLRDGSVPGDGIAQGLIEGDWPSIRQMTYGERGG